MLRPAICDRCKKPLKREDPDPFKIKNKLPEVYLATICTQCHRVECFACRGGEGLPCSWCKGEIDGAFVHLFRELEK